MLPCKTMVDQSGGVEENRFALVTGERVTAVSDGDVDGSTADGKASSMQFVGFPVQRRQIDCVRIPGPDVRACIAHPTYGHMAVLPETIRATRSEDFV